MTSNLISLKKTLNHLKSSQKSCRRSLVSHLYHADSLRNFARRCGPTSARIECSFHKGLSLHSSSGVRAGERSYARSATGGQVQSPVTDIQAQDPISDLAKQNLRTAANACRRYGWIAFWVQLVLSSVAAVIILFSMAFTSQTGPQISLYLTLFGIVLGFLSTFWSYGYTRLSRRLTAFLDSSGEGEPPKIRRSDVINMLEKGAIINALGAGASMLGLQATIGLLVAKTLTTATVNPFLASNTTTWNPVLAFDVFNVQATTNALLSHFFSLLVSLWLLRVIANRPSAVNVIGKPAVA